MRTVSCIQGFTCLPQFLEMFFNHVLAGRSFDAFRADEQVSLLWSFAIVSVQSNVLCSSRCLKVGPVGRAGRAALSPCLHGTRKLLSLGGYIGTFYFFSFFSDKTSSGSGLTVELPPARLEALEVVSLLEKRQICAGP